MYLNIINNINIENKRKHKKIYISKEEKQSNEEEQSNNAFLEDFEINTYYSIFYGELTKNWIMLSRKKQIKK